MNVWRRPDPRRLLARDLSRRARREKGQATFWRSLSTIGMVGWPIAIFAVGGTLLGHVIDAYLDSGLRCTLMLLSAGTFVGCYLAWRAIGGGR